MSIAQRIERIVAEKENGNQSKFARKTGMNRGTLGNIISHDRSVNSDNLEKILEAYPSLNARWLITGKGKMWSNETVGELQEDLEVCLKRNAELEEKLVDHEEMVTNLNRLSSFLRADIDRMKKEQGLE